MEEVLDAKFLESQEVMKLQILQLSLENRTFAQENLKLKSENLILRNNLKINEFEMHKVSMRKDLAELKAKIAADYGIKDENWGYDPRTGEIT